MILLKVILKNDSFRNHLQTRLKCAQKERARIEAHPSLNTSCTRGVPAAVSNCPVFTPNTSACWGAITQVNPTESRVELSSVSAKSVQTDYSPRGIDQNLDRPKTKIIVANKKRI